MNRRTFVKGFLFSLPSLSIRPLDAISNRLIDSANLDTSNGLSLIFIGNYGRQIMQQFRGLYQSEPILHPCEHILGTISPRMQLVEIKHDIVPDCGLLAALFSDTIILIFDGRTIDDYALIEVLSGLIKRLGNRSLTIVMSPFALLPLHNSQFDLTFQTWQNHIDFMPHILHTFYKTYVGCGRLGNLLCLKAQLQDLLHAKCSRGILLYQNTFHHLEEIGFFAKDLALDEHFKSFMKVNSTAVLWSIVEMYRLESHALKTIEIFVDHQTLSTLDWLVLPHLSLVKNQYRVTVFGLAITQ